MPTDKWKKTQKLIAEWYAIGILALCENHKQIDNNSFITTLWILILESRIADFYLFTQFSIFTIFITFIMFIINIED